MLGLFKINARRMHQSRTDTKGRNAKWKLNGMNDAIEKGRIAKDLIK
jgi:hypothetical protein